MRLIITKINGDAFMATGVCLKYAIEIELTEEQENKIKRTDDIIDIVLLNEMRAE